MKRKSISFFEALLLIIVSLIVVLLFIVSPIQMLSHSDGAEFHPDYEKVDISAYFNRDIMPILNDGDYSLILSQSGLGKPAVDNLRARGKEGQETALEIQKQFFAPLSVICDPMILRFTCEDRLVDKLGYYKKSPKMIDIEEGDILITLSTHSVGWRHGHGGVVVKDDNGNFAILESAVIGNDSGIFNLDYWQRYSNYAVLRLKDSKKSDRQAIANNAVENLVGVPYRLTSGLRRPNVVDHTSKYFGAHCFYLVWYAYNSMGYDIDANGGKIVIGTDILDSDKLEVVQVYGLDPDRFFS